VPRGVPAGLPGRQASRRFLPCALIVLALLVFPPPATAKECAADVKGPAARANARGLPKLIAVPGRSAFVLPIRDDQSRSDDITFATKPQREVGRKDRDATAALLVYPRQGDDRFAGDVFVKAAPGPTSHHVTMVVCITGRGVFSDRFTAGTYSGTVVINGPRFSELTYPITITSKWPAVIPILTLTGVIILYVFGTWSSPSTPGPRATVRASIIYTVIAVAAAALTYWSAYVKNATWGEDPAAQIWALIVAAFTAALAGQQAAKRWAPSGSDDGNQRRRGRRPRSSR
jgi:hypothetical protein